MYKLRIAALILLAVLCLSTVTSCGSGGDKTPIKDAYTSAQPDYTVAKTEAPDPWGDGLPDSDFGGTDFTVLIRTEYNYEFVAEQSGDILEDEIFARNRTAEERFNIKLGFIEKVGNTGASNSEFNTAYMNAYQAGDAAYDLVMGYQAYSCPLSMAGMVRNSLEMPYIDTTREWWYQIAKKDLTINGKYYFLMGNIGTSMWNSVYVLYFNKTVKENHGIDDNLYKIVSDGDWTFDRFTSLVRGVSADLDGDNSYTEADLYGYMSDSSNHLRQYCISADAHIAAQGSDSYPVLDFYNEHNVNVINTVCSFFWEDCVFRTAKDTSSPVNFNMPEMFASDRALFMAGFLSKAQILRSMESDYGIILQPKFDEKQKDYRVAVANGCSVVLFPIYLKNEDMSGIVTEALCAAGNNSILPVYYEYSLKSKGTRDAESEAMLDFIISRISFDFGWVHSISIATIGAALSTMIGSGNSDFASFYAANAQAYEAGFQTVLYTYKEIG